MEGSLSSILQTSSTRGEGIGPPSNTAAAHPDFTVNPSDATLVTSAAEADDPRGLVIRRFGNRDRRASPTWTTVSRLADRNIRILWAPGPVSLDEARQQTFEKAEHGAPYTDARSGAPRRSKAATP
jgi:hypothetical protein